MSDLLLSAEKGGQQQVALRSGTENGPLCHPFLAMGGTSNTFKIWVLGLFCMYIPNLGSETK
jgi:hypothetical protein